MQPEVLCADPCDAPAGVVELHVVVSAEQDSSVDVCSAFVGCPFVDVVCFAVGGGAVAAFPSAASVADGECDALPGREQSMLPPHIQGIAVRVNSDRD